MNPREQRLAHVCTAGAWRTCRAPMHATCMARACTRVHSGMRTWPRASMPAPAVQHPWQATRGEGLDCTSTRARVALSHAGAAQHAAAVRAAALPEPGGAAQAGPHSHAARPGRHAAGRAAGRADVTRCLQRRDCAKRTHGDMCAGQPRRWQLACRANQGFQSTTQQEARLEQQGTRLDRQVAQLVLSGCNSTFHSVHAHANKFALSLGRHCQPQAAWHAYMPLRAPRYVRAHASASSSVGVAWNIGALPIGLGSG